MRKIILPLVFMLSANPAWCQDPGPANDSRGIEAKLVESMLSISSSKLDIALNEVDSLLKSSPNFKLAQLVKGDLLLARAQPLNTFGNVPGAPKGQMEDLRDEALVRLQRVQEQSPLNLVPKYLWQLDDEQKYAVVIDTSKSTLYLYENVNGKPRYVTDYYISSGKNGVDKLVEGDQKTPLGVYFVEAKLPKNKLTDLYGDAAYPLNYPNEWDRRQGRKGHGIWLHGTPSDTYSRPPRASNGCVVLSNDDLEVIGGKLQIGVTPVVITDRMEWSNAQDQADRTALLDELEQWRKDWSSLDTDSYLKHYSRSFAGEGMNYSEWKKRKEAVNAGKSWITVKISNLSLFAYPTDPNLAVVDFDQDYSSNNLSDKIKKRQYWLKQNDRWQIIYEGTS